MTIEEAQNYLKQFVKGSAIPGQTHIARDLVPAEQLERFDQALLFIHQKVREGELKMDEFKRELGLS